MRRYSHRPERLPGRTGFTLIEVLVVIAIIAILAALLASGIFQYIASQKQANTETLIRTLDKLLNKHWDAVVTEAKKEIPSPAVVSLAGGDMRRAQVIWVKFRLAEAFPVSFAEIRGGPPLNVPLLYQNYPVTKTPFIPQAQQKYLATYAKALAQAGALSGDNGENITCLVLALQQSRAGIAYNLEDQVPYAVTDYLTPAMVAAGPMPRLKMLVDGWGTPLGFFRFPCGNAELDSKNPAGPRPVNPKTAHSTASIFRDPLDPEGLLQQPVWNTQASFTGKGPVYLFEQLTLSQIHTGGGLAPPLGQPPPWFPLPKTPSAGAYTPYSFYTVPVIASAGPNGPLGPKTPPYAPSEGFNLDAFMGMYDQVTPTNVHLGDDDIYSFRLRLGARGD